MRLARDALSVLRDWRHWRRPLGSGAARIGASWIGASRIGSPRSRPGALVTALVLAAVLGGGALAQGGGLNLDWHTMDGGGAAAQAGALTLAGTVGQPDSGRAAGGGYTLTGGFWAGVGAQYVAPTPTLTPPVEPSPTSPVGPTPTTPIQPTNTPPAVPSITPIPEATPTTVPPQIVVVDMPNAYRFAPDPIVVRVGDIVRWANTDDVPHSSTSGLAGSPNGVWDSGFLSPGQTYERIFDQPGVFLYHCRVHPLTMRGTVYAVPAGPSKVPGPVIFLPFNGR